MGDWAPEKTAAPVKSKPSVCCGAEMDHVLSQLSNDSRIKVAGIDCDGILRGKIMSKEKFVSSIRSGFGMSSAVFGWDMHDVLYTAETKITSAEAGYADFLAFPDLKSFRRIPWEDNVPLFLLNFENDGVPVYADGRNLLRSLCDKAEELGFKAMAGVELEFLNFQTPSADGYGSHPSPPNLAAFLKTNTPSSLRPLTEGMFGYSLTRPVANKKYYYEIFDQSDLFKCNVEGWHTESGPGVFEAALKVNEISEIADRVTLFKYLTKSVGVEHGVTPCFMAKPIEGLPGNSGHIHISLCDTNGVNLFARDTPDESAEWKDIAQLSDVGRYFLAGILEALPEIMPMLAPTINSYKRLIENYWAPVNVSWGLEDRLSSIRLITPPICKPGATRFEVRIPGADLHPHYALGALFAAGLRGIEKQLTIPVPPTSVRKDMPERLPNSLAKALERFSAPTSVARELFGSAFVDFYTTSREHELRVWREAVTDWEFRRYIENV